MRPRRRSRRGSALILVLLMTLAVAGLAIAAIFLSSSAGLLSRFYDREREYRLASESAIEMIRARLERDTTLVVTDTGVVQLLAGAQVPTASGSTVTGVRVNLFAAITGDTTPGGVPTLTLIAAAYDAGGTRHVRRVDLRRESFSSYELLADSVPTSVSFGPGIVNGRVHTNGTWRGGSGSSAPTFRDSVTAVTAVAGGGTYAITAQTGVPRIRYPRDSTYAGLAARANAAHLSFVPVAETGAGYRTGSRLQFVMVDVDNDGRADVDEGFVRVFDLASGQDTSRIKVGLDHNRTFFFIIPGRRWDEDDVQNQCGAMYLRDGRWSFFPISTHRATWARAVIQRTGGGDFPAVSVTDMNLMNNYDFDAVAMVLQQPTARCYPAGSPHLMTAERMTNAAGVVTNTSADTVPFGVVTPPGGWPLSAPSGYGGSDTTFTVRSRTCRFSTSGTSGRCSGPVATLGSWRSFTGTAITGVPTSVRQGVELPYLWPLASSRNAASTGVVYADGGPLFVSGTTRGAVTLVVNGPVFLVDALTTAQNESESQTACTDRLGLLAVGDVLVADNGLTRGRRVFSSTFSLLNVSRLLGGNREFRLDANVMSLTGTVGIENPGTVGVSPQACPQDVGAAWSGGCFRLRGSAAMRIMSDLSAATNAGFMYAGSTNACRTSRTRPPYFPLTNRYAFVRALEVVPSQANTPTKLRSLLLRLKGKAL